MGSYVTMASLTYLALMDVGISSWHKLSHPNLSTSRRSRLCIVPSTKVMSNTASRSSSMSESNSATSKKGKEVQNGPTLAELPAGPVELKLVEPKDGRTKA